MRTFKNDGIKLSSGFKKPSQWISYKPKLDHLNKIVFLMDGIILYYLYLS